jgi:hypothetical protein
LQYHRQPFNEEDYEEDKDSENRVQVSDREGGATELSPVNMEEFQYQHQLIEELIVENKQLREQLEQTEGKLRKVEGQLNKTK